MTRTGKKLLAAAALSTLAAPGVAAANPNAAPAPAATVASKLQDPPRGCMLKVYDPATKSYWYVGNGKNMPDQASLDSCKQLQAVLTAHDKAIKAPVQAPHKQVARMEFGKIATRVLYVPAVGTTAGK